ncbi:Aste57867_20122 [Aphanomyces stellatus]|uniref:Aste57867_20122 protein n=1 Tax=Aphanomyces stellatus TaxID=120398 RepID=A0A485LED4_9STRA|nr:hypothetical protein As57867_020056 [Aphanomyces stellatus]VFT96817.1 Aste57867_20122 [Aphanomyces stellatus]
MDILLEKIVAGEAVTHAELEAEGFKHVFMEVMELIRVEEASVDADARFQRLVRVQLEVLNGLPENKRGVFLEDAFSMLLRKTQSSHEFDSLVLAHVLHVVDTLLAPSIHHIDGEALKANPPLLRQCKSVVGCVLAVLGRSAASYLQQDHEPTTTAQLETAMTCLLRSGIPVQDILRMAKWKAYSQEWTAVVLPNPWTHDDDDDDDDDDAADLDDNSDLVDAMQRMLLETIPDACATKYLHNPAWSDLGLAVVAHVHVMAAGAVPDTTALDTLETIAPYAQRLLEHDDSAVKVSGLTMVALLLQRHLSSTPTIHVSIPPTNFQESQSTIVGLNHFAQHRVHRHYSRLLFQAIMTAMVTLLDPADRAKALRVWHLLVDVIDVPSRFTVLATLVQTCPYPNCVAVVLDRLRTDVARHWAGASLSFYCSSSSLLIAQAVEVYATSTALVPFLCEMLRPVPDTEFVPRSDACISALSLLRFVSLRDKTNVTGLRSHRDLHQQLAGQRRRLTDLVVNQASVAKSRQDSHVVVAPSSPTTIPGAPQPDCGDELIRLQLMLAAFDAALATFTDMDNPVTV